MSSLIPYFYNFERPYRQLQREIFNPEDFFGHSLRPVAQEFFGPQRMYRALEMSQPLEQLSAAMNQLAMQERGSKITSDDEKFQVNIDVQHFAPEEITVKVIKNEVLVEGKHEEKQDNHGYISRHFVRRYVLPQGCLPDTVESKLSSDGVLTITAPKVLALPSTGEKIVPIKQTGPVKQQLEK